MRRKRQAHHNILHTQAAQRLKRYAWPDMRSILFILTSRPFKKTSLSASSEFTTPVVAPSPPSAAVVRTYSARNCRRVVSLGNLLAISKANPACSAHNIDSTYTLMSHITAVIVKPCQAPRRCTHHRNDWQYRRHGGLCRRIHSQ